MPRIIQLVQLSKLDTLPGTSRCPADMDCDGATVVVLENGIVRVVVWVEHPQRTLSIRYNYEVDKLGGYVLGSARYRGHHSIATDTAEIQSNS